MAASSCTEHRQAAPEMHEYVRWRKNEETSSECSDGMTGSHQPITSKQPLPKQSPSSATRSDNNKKRNASGGSHDEERDAT
ncbi:hypothetical protein O3P69_005829 [Scylla paramamosain]|uniref:Uncharacterized protein n=1 Tax=Scylla paramamosain TaxID=85552 RepID=A0AAW0U3Q4_SCYPA